MFTHKAENRSTFISTKISVTSDSADNKLTIGDNRELNVASSHTAKRMYLNECDSDFNNEEPQRKYSRHFCPAASSVSELIENKEICFSKCNVQKCDIKKSPQNRICSIERHSKCYIEVDGQISSHVVNENLKEIKSQHVVGIGDSTTAYSADLKGNVRTLSKSILKFKQRMNILPCSEKNIGPMYSKSNTNNSQQEITRYMIKGTLNRNKSSVYDSGKGDSSLSTSSVSLSTKNRFSYFKQQMDKKESGRKLLEPIKHPICSDAKDHNKEIQCKTVLSFMNPENKTASDVNSSPISQSPNLNKDANTKHCKMESERNHMVEPTEKAFSSDTKNSKCNGSENWEFDRQEALNKDCNIQYVSRLKSQLLSPLLVSDEKEDSDLNKRILSLKQSILLDRKVIWKNITRENLFLQYARLYPVKMADYIFQRLEEEVEYFSGDLVRVMVHGKWHDVPRKQAAYGDSGLSYFFSGNSIPAIPWNKSEIIKQLKHVVESVCHHTFNFVLVNRYKDGLDHMGEHRDDEKCMVFNAPIASLSFGQARDFIFKHKDSRGKQCVRKIDPLKIELENGSILVMKHPTNTFWYHSLPVRKKAFNTRVNLTFRDMVKK